MTTPLSPRQVNQNSDQAMG